MNFSPRSHVFLNGNEHFSLLPTKRSSHFPLPLSSSSLSSLSKQNPRSRTQMRMALSFQSQCLHSHHSFLSRRVIKTGTLLPSNNLPIIASKGSILTHRRFSSRSVFSRKKKKRSGYQRFTRLVLKLIPVIASELKASPPRPLRLLAEELGGGDGNGGGGSGLWGGSGWGWFDGWRRGGRRKLGFWAILVACGLSLMFVGEMESLAACKVLGLGFLGIGLMEGWSKKKGTAVVKNGILGICFLGAVSFWGLRKEEVRRRSWVRGLALRRQRRRRPGKFW